MTALGFVFFFVGVMVSMVAGKPGGAGRKFFRPVDWLTSVAILGGLLFMVIGLVIFLWKTMP